MDNKIINVFIDTSVFLNFYGFSNDHLDKLEGFLSLIKTKKVNLIIDQLILDEFYRRRESTLNEKTLDRLRSFNKIFNLQIPLPCKDFSEIKEFNKNCERLKSLAKTLETKIKKQVVDKSLRADKIIDNIFKITNIIEISSEIFEKAKNRSQLGNPPGKKNSYGDAIHWEIILKYAPANDNLFLLADDSDFKSNIDDNNLLDFLNEEWKRKKMSNIIFYTTISKFISDRFPDIKITKDDIKEEENYSTYSYRSHLPQDILELINEYQKNYDSSAINEYQKMIKAYPNIGDQMTEIERKARTINALITSLGLKDKK